MLAKLERQARLVFEHKPKELRIAVNGNFQGTLKVNSELNEIDLAIADKEPIEFIEIYSEQQLRLMMLNFDQKLPYPEANSAHTLSLSDDRFLQVTIGFSAQGAEIRLSYQDPTYKQVQAILENRNSIDEVIFPISENAHRLPSIPSVRNRFAEYTSPLTSVFSFRWRRFAVAFLAVTIAIGGWIIFEQQNRLSAKAVLEESEKKRLNWQYQPDKILYWEETEKLQSSDRLFRSKRWINNLDGQHQRLMLKYDEQNRLYWGKWVKGDGTIIVFELKTGVTVEPGIPLINEKMPALSEEDRQILQTYLNKGEIKAQREEQSEIHLNWILNNYTTQSVKNHEIDDNRKAICVFVRSGRENQTSKVRATELEVDYDEKTFQRVLYRRKLFLDDGTTQMEESRLLSAREATLEEFENNELAKLLAENKSVKYLTVEELVKKVKPLFAPAKK